NISHFRVLFHNEEAGFAAPGVYAFGQHYLHTVPDLVRYVSRDPHVLLRARPDALHGRRHSPADLSDDTFVAYDPGDSCRSHGAADALAGASRKIRRSPKDRAVHISDLALCLYYRRACLSDAVSALSDAV